MPDHDGDCAQLLREDIADWYRRECAAKRIIPQRIDEQIVYTLRCWYKELDHADYYDLCAADEAFHEGKDIPPRSPWLCRGCMDAIAELLHLLGSKPPAFGYGILNTESIP
jgi:hypothetical protein